MINSIKKLLQIQDENIEITSKAEEEIVKGQKTLIINAKLTYTTKRCVCNKCNSKCIVKDGFRNTKVKLLKVSELPVIMNLKKQLYKCKNCNTKFSAQTKLVDKNCNISRPVKVTILGKLKETISNKYISKYFHVSQSTIIRIMQEASRYMAYNVYKDLPEHLCFDEIKSTKDADNKMSFVCADAETGKFIDIVDGRTNRVLKPYFKRIPLRIRNKVKTICIDIYQPYMKIIRELFPKAKIIIDRFHIVQNINREFNKYRIEVMNRIRNKKRSDYTKLKKYWQLLLKDASEISYAKAHYSKTFGRTVTNKQVLDYIMTIDATLARNYKVMQDIRYALKTRNLELFENIINNKDKEYSKGMNKAINTIRKHSDYMNNSIKYSYSNGVLEGINNKIKLIKRVSYGYSSFYNFRLRILIVFRLFEDEYKQNKNITQHKFAA